MEEGSDTPKRMRIYFYLLVLAISFAFLYYRTQTFEISVVGIVLLLPVVGFIEWALSRPERN